MHLLSASRQWCGRNPITRSRLLRGGEVCFSTERVSSRDQRLRASAEFYTVVSWSTVKEARHVLHESGLEQPACVHAHLLVSINIHLLAGTYNLELQIESKPRWVCKSAEIQLICWSTELEEVWSVVAWISSVGLLVLETACFKFFKDTTDRHVRQTEHENDFSAKELR
jgi:hypothetical protein